MSTSQKELFGYSVEEYEKFKHCAHRVLWVFCVFYCFVYCGRLNLTLALSSITEDLGWTLGQAGIVTSTIFWAYGFGHLINGRLSEVIGAKKTIFIGGLGSALLNVAVGFQDNFFIICLLWGANGYFQSMIWSPGLSLISKWWPNSLRGFANGMASGSSALSSVVAWAIIYITFILFPDSGWQIAFRFPILFMFLGTFLFYFLTPKDPQSVNLKDYQESSSSIAEREKEIESITTDRGYFSPYFVLLRNVSFNIWLVIIALSTICRYGLLTWIPLYYVNVFDTNIKEGLIGTIGLPIGMALGSFIIPWLTDKFCPNNRHIAAIFCAICSGVVVILFSQAEAGFIASGLLFMAGFFIYAINGIAWVYAIEVGGRSFSGTAAGILDWAAYMGAAIQALIFGTLLDLGYNWDYVFQAIGLVCALITISAAFVSYRTSAQSKSTKRV